MIRRLVALSLCIAVIFTGAAALGESESGKSADAGKGLRITLEVPPVWTRGEEITLRVKLEALDDSFDLFNPASQLLLQGDGNDPEYCAPLDLVKGLPLEPNSTLPRSPRPETPIEIKLSPDKLKWGRWIAAVWPRDDLFDMVEPGKYRLYIDVSIRTIDSTGQEFWSSSRSNQVRIQIK